MEPATRGSRHEARLRYGGLRTADRGVIQYVKYVKYVKSGGKKRDGLRWGILPRPGVLGSEFGIAVVGFRDHMEG